MQMEWDDGQPADQIANSAAITLKVGGACSFVYTTSLIFPIFVFSRIYLVFFFFPP